MDLRIACSLNGTNDSGGAGWLRIRSVTLPESRHRSFKATYHFARNWTVRGPTCSISARATACSYAALGQGRAGGRDRGREDRRDLPPAGAGYIRQDDYASNLSLETFLDRLHGIGLPVFEAGDAFNPVAYCGEVADANLAKAGWEVIADQMVLV